MFARPWLLPLLLLIPLWWWLRRRRDLPAARYSDVSIPAAVSRGRWWVSLPPALRSVSLASLVLAAAGFRAGGEKIETKRS